MRKATHPARSVFAALVCAAMAALAGCSGANTSSGSSGSGNSSGSRAAQIYTIQDVGGGGIMEFPATSSGAAVPNQNLADAETVYVIDSVAVDNKGQVYVLSGYGVGGSLLTVSVFAANSPRGASPTRSFSVNSPGDPLQMAVDTTGNVYVSVWCWTCNLPQADQYSIEVYPSTASGITTPTRTITGANTGITGDLYVATDPAGNLYVDNSHQQILVFSPTANGNVAPIRTIDMPTTYGNFEGLAVDANSNLHVVYQACTSSAQTSCSSEILEYSSTANGAATPTNTIVSTTSLGPGGVYQDLAVDVGGYLYVTGVVPAAPDEAPSLYDSAVFVFSPDATGNVAPSYSMTSIYWRVPDYTMDIAVF